MTENSACDVLAARYKEKAAAGLLDVKFYLRHSDEALKEEICAEAIRLDEALDRGDFVPLVFDDRHS